MRYRCPQCGTRFRYPGTCPACLVDLADTRECVSLNDAVLGFHELTEEQQRIAKLMSETPHR